MDTAAPDGSAARVIVHLIGERIEPDVGQLVPPWMFFEVDDGGLRRVVAVRPEQIVRVEIRLVRENEGEKPKQRPGFRIREEDEEPLGS
jgi:hypothetical protein